MSKKSKQEKCPCRKCNSFWPSCTCDKYVMWKYGKIDMKDKKNEQRDKV